MSVSNLKNILLNNVVDIRFTRRNPVRGRPKMRRMLCTKSYELLNSTNGRIVLNYKAPKNEKQFNEAKNNALVVWDIIMQDYRVIPADSVEIIKQIPATDFWTFFNEEVYIMSAEQKQRYMNT